MGAARVEDLKAIRLKLCFSALERNMNQSAFFFSLSLTCTVRDVCVVCGFFPSYIEEIKAEKRRSAVNQEPQLESGFAASAGFSVFFFYIKKHINTNPPHEGSCNLRNTSCAAA